MASQFDVELSMRESQSEAQSLAAAALADAARNIGLRLSKQSAGELQYKPTVQFPFLLVLWRNLQGQRMTVTFSPGADGGTKVSIRGAVASNRQPLASDPEHWTGPLGGTSTGS